MLVVPGTLGTGATFNMTVNRIGAITSINILDYGEDYISVPLVSFVVEDIAVSGVNIFDLPSNQDIVYQGANTQFSTYQGYVDSIELLQPNANTLNSIYRIRVYNYSGTFNPAKLLNDNNLSYSMTISTGFANYGANGVIIYGDGTARGTAKFLNGLVIGQGTYITTQGQLSAFSVLQSPDYNSFTYRLTVEKEIAKYRDILLNLLHPTGTHVIPIYDLRSILIQMYSHITL